MLVRMSRAPVPSGGLRRKTQLFSGTLYMALPPGSHLTSRNVLRSSKPRSKCQFSQEAVCCVIIPKVKNIRHNFIPLSPGGKNPDFQRFGRASPELAKEVVASNAMQDPSRHHLNYKTGGIIHQLIEQPGHAVESAATSLEVVRGRVSADKDQAEEFRVLSGAAAEEEMSSGNQDSICVVGIIEDAEGKIFA
ncbi:hypothetical protein TNCV_1614981 [Trichonephila clavipes]|nr:hypothetical protein TNCV_1614981 [Trichonephila clavipes]